MQDEIDRLEQSYMRCIETGQMFEEMGCSDFARHCYAKGAVYATKACGLMFARACLDTLKSAYIDARN